MRQPLQLLGWLISIIYSTIPVFWLMIHPFADRWRARDRSAHRSPFAVLLPLWIIMWIVVGIATRPWRAIILYRQNWTWMAALIIFCCGLYLYLKSAKNFSGRQLAGVPEVYSSTTQQFLVTGGIRSRVRHPIYLAHLCEMLGWSTGTGLAVCWGLTAFAVVMGAVMIRMEDAELEKRFGKDYLEYRRRVPALFPRLRSF
jgi:protein-S-isoprenylcysteine O-methyltransferase Ste14